MITNPSANHQPRSSLPSPKNQNTQPSKVPPKCNSTNQPTHTLPRQGPTTNQKMQSETKFKSMIGMKNPRKMKQQKKRS
jgi:hypothetical protein